MRSTPGSRTAKLPIRFPPRASATALPIARARCARIRKWHTIRARATPTTPRTSPASRLAATSVAGRSPLIADEQDVLRRRGQQKRHAAEQAHHPQILLRLQETDNGIRDAERQHFGDFEFDGLNLLREEDSHHADEDDGRHSQLSEQEGHASVLFLTFYFQR